MEQDEQPDSPAPEDKPPEREVPAQESSEDEDQQEDPETSTQLLRSSWEFASTIQFCRMFSSTLKLKNFSADFYERALLYPDDHQMFLSELVYKLLRPDATAPYTLKDSDEWEHMLHRRFNRHWHEYYPKNPLRTRGFFDVSPLTRVENPDFTSDALRHYPIGEDAKGNRYYYFSANNEDCRLYREEPPKNRKGKKGKDVEEQEVKEAGWFTQCISLEEFEEFAEKLTNSRNKLEQQLYKLLTNEILPKLIETANQRRRAEEKAALLESMPRKRSDRIQMLARKKEEEVALGRAGREVEERRRSEDRARRMADGQGHFGEGSKPLTREERFRLRQERLAQMIKEQEEEDEEDEQDEQNEQDKEEDKEQPPENGAASTSSSSVEEPAERKPAAEPTPMPLRHSERKRSRTQSTFIPQLLGMSSRSVHQRRRTGKRRPQSNLGMLTEASHGIPALGMHEPAAQSRPAKRQATEGARRNSALPAQLKSAAPMRGPPQPGPRAGHGQRPVITTSLNEMQRNLPTVQQALSPQEHALLQRQRMMQQLQQESGQTAQQQAAMLQQQQHLLQMLQQQRQKSGGALNGLSSPDMGQRQHPINMQAGPARQPLAAAQQPPHHSPHAAGMGQMMMSQQNHAQQRPHPQQFQQQSQQPPQQQQPTPQQQQQRAILEQLLRQLTPQQQQELQSMSAPQKQQAVMQLLSMHQQRVRQQQQLQQQQQAAQHRQQGSPQLGQPHMSSMMQSQLDQQRAHQLQQIQQLQQQRSGLLQQGSGGGMAGLASAAQGGMGGAGKMMDHRGLGMLGGPGQLSGGRQFMPPGSPTAATQPGAPLARMGSGMPSSQQFAGSAMGGNPSLFGVANPMRSLHGGQMLGQGGAGLQQSQFVGAGYGQGMGQAAGRALLLPDGNFDLPFA